MEQIKKVYKTQLEVLTNKKKKPHRR
jgi:hypothetical protein